MLTAALQEGQGQEEVSVTFCLHLFCIAVRVVCFCIMVVNTNVITHICHIHIILIRHGHVTSQLVYVDLIGWGGD